MMRQLFDALGRGAAKGKALEEQRLARLAAPSAASLTYQFMGNLTALEMDGDVRKFHVLSQTLGQDVKSRTLLYTTPARAKGFAATHGFHDKTPRFPYITGRFNPDGSLLMIDQEQGFTEYKSSDVILALSHLLRWTGEQAPHREKEIRRMVEAQGPRIQKIMKP